MTHQQRQRRLLLACFASLVSGHAMAVQIPPPGPIPTPIAMSPLAVELAPIASGLHAPNYLTSAGDGTNRLFVTDQTGQIRLIKNGALASQPFLDTSSRLVTLGGIFADYDERGLLSVAFHPDFSKPGSAGYGRLYTFTSEPVDPLAAHIPLTHSQPLDNQAVVSEWRVSATNPDAVDPASRRELLRVDHPQFNHNGGQLAFGPDNMLYVGLGDGGAANDVGDGHGASGNGQNPHTVLGSILRINVDGSGTPSQPYSIPADNPFAGQPQTGAQEIYAYGFRNPFRFSFDKATGRLIAGDVGQDNIEEVDVVSKGGNYGWNTKEGTFVFDPATGLVSIDSSGHPGLIDPVLQYDHDEGIAVIGGFVYRGSAIPALAGKYVFGDFSKQFASPGGQSPLGRLFVGDLATGTIQALQIGQNDRPLGLYVKGFGEDAAGELYVLGGMRFGVSGNDGVVLKIVPTAVPLPASAWLLGAGLVAVARRRTAHVRAIPD